MSTRLLQARWPWLVAAAVLALVYASTLVEFGRKDPRPLGSLADIEGLADRKDLKVLFILIDTLRADRLSAWGYPRETSPMIDWLAAGGVRFGRHLSQSSWTKCSMASLWTSLYPQRSGITRFDQVLTGEAKLPAEILREAGFRTVGLYRNGWVGANFGFSQGFEVYHQPAALPLAANERRQNPSMREPASDTSAVEAFRSFLSVSARDRWFVYIHLMDVHQYTYDERSAMFGTSISDIYDNSIRREDGLVESIMAELDAAGVFDETLVVISSDHGEAFGERGFEGHARNVYQEVTEVPFVISFPFRLEPGLVIGARTENVDVWPTLLDLLGLPPLEPSDGKSLVPLIQAAARGEAMPPGENAFAHIDQTWGQNLPPAPMVAVASDGFRYLLAERGERREELFDHSADPIETVDVRERNPEVTERLRAAARAYLDSEPPWSAQAEDLELDEMEKNQLRALGYALP